MVVSVAINALIPAGIIWAVGKPPPLTLFGAEPIIGSMLPAAGLATLAMTFILTLIIRARVRRGSLRRLDWPRDMRGLMRFIPQPLALRAVALGVLAIVLLVPAGLAVVGLLDILPFDRIDYLIFNLVYGACVGLVMAPFVVLPALADEARS